MIDDRQWYQHNLRCRMCAHRFHVKRLTADANKVRPNCPKCGGRTKQSFQADVGFDPAEGKAPAQIGSIPVRAYDAAMEITMQDHGITDIQDHSRPGAVYRAGETSAPKLRPDLQAQADNFWGGPAKPKRMGKIDMSPLYGARAQNNGVTPGQFNASSGSLIEPILKHKPTGTSAVPDYTPINPPGT